MDATILTRAKSSSKCERSNHPVLPCGAIFQAKEPKSSNKSRHVLRKAHLIRDYVEQKEIALCKIGTDDNISDPLTKALPHSKHEGHIISMGIKRVPELY